MGRIPATLSHRVMAKLSINFLLYTASLGFAGGSGYLFYETMSAPEQQTPREIYDEAMASIDSGRKLTPDDRRDEYTEAAKPWWESFSQANFTGALPPEPVAVEDDAETHAPPPVSSMPADEIVNVLSITFDSAGADSWCIVQYKDTNVQPPVNAFTGVANPGYGGPVDISRGAAPAAAGPNAMPSYAGGPVLIQHLKIGDSLWPPHQNVVLSRISDDGLSVFFKRSQVPEKPGDGDAEANADGGTGEPSADSEEEKVYKNELGLATDVIEAINDGAAPIDRPDRGRPKPKVVEVTTWIDVGEETRAVRPGEYHVSRKDSEYLRKNAQQVFSEDIAMRSYRSPRGNISGVRVMRVSPRLERFGVQAGDVLLELNGVPVKNKAQALKVGKAQYNRGVRLFRAKVLNRYGRVEERSYNAPDN